MFNHPESHAVNHDVNRLPFPLEVPPDAFNFPLQQQSPMARVPVPATNMAIEQPVTERDTQTRKSKGRRRKSKDKNSDSDKPKRPLSAYNLFFQHERVVLLKNLPVRAQGKPKHSHGKLGFVEMARIIGYKWKRADKPTRMFYDVLANRDRARYELEMEEYNKKQEATMQSDGKKQSPPTPSPISSCTSTPSSDDPSDVSTVDDMEPISYRPNQETGNDTVLQLDSEMVDILVKSFS